VHTSKVVKYDYPFIYGVSEELLRQSSPTRYLHEITFSIYLVIASARLLALL
jgi:hypothetical protein